jgi:hypothetical protein
MSFSSILEINTNSNFNNFPFSLKVWKKEIKHILKHGNKREHFIALPRPQICSQHPKENRSKIHFFKFKDKFYQI